MIKYIAISKSNAVDGSEDHFIQELRRNLEDGDHDEADQEGAGREDDDWSTISIPSLIQMTS